MQLKSGFAVLGALVGAVVIVVLDLAVGLGWIMLGIVAGLGLVSYVVAAIGARSLSCTTGFGEFMRGWLIGKNAALNAVLGYAIVARFAGTAGGLPVAVVLGTVNFLAVFAPISQNGFFQGVLGWLNWLMPMSWLVVALGVTFSLFSLLLHAVTGGKVAYLAIQDVDADWKTGTVFMKGGLIANLNHRDTAFNMGNFCFVDYLSPAWHKDHEAGHALNLGAFGSLFHLIGAFDENATPRGANAFAERLAESNDTGTTGSNIPMWSA